MGDWILVSDRLPAVDQIVVAKTTWGSLYVVQFFGCDYLPIFLWDGFRTGGIAAWAPLANDGALAPSHASYEELLAALVAVAEDVRSTFVLEIGAQQKMPATLLPDILDRVSAKLRARLAKLAAAR